MAKSPELNYDQKKAIEHAGGSLIVVAGAGTGKTRVITERIRYLIQEKGVDPDSILALTFTEKAASEMLERIGDIMPLGYKEPWVSTFHSFADRVLKKEGLEIGLDISYQILTYPKQWLLVRKNLFDFDLNYYRPLGNPTKFISAVLKFISRLQDEGVDDSDFEKFVRDVKGDVEDKNRWLELAGFYRKYQALKLQHSYMDFGDLILWCLKLFTSRPNILKQYQKQFSHTMVDEFQDTNFAQYELIKKLFPLREAAGRSLMVVGDDSQCLPPDALISIKGGTKRIEDIEIGDTVLTAVGKGHTSFSKVLNKSKRIQTSRLLTFITEDGKKITVTDNHKMFCFTPAHSESKDYHYVYLMHQQDLGWRIGVTNNIPSRLRLEYHADEIFALGSYTTDQEARFYETLLAAKYQLPTVTFRSRPGQALTDKWLDKLFKELDTETGARRLAEDLHLDLESPLFCVDAVTRGVSERLKVNLLMCNRNYRSKNHKDGMLQNPHISHLVHFETSNEKAIDILQKMGFEMQKAKKGKRFRFQSKNINEAWEIAEQISVITGAKIDKKFKVGRFNYQHLPSRIMPASHVVPGLYLPVAEGGQVLYKLVVSRTEEVKEIKTYDIEVENTHNFVADGVIVHNSIYKFRGAAISNILEFREDYKKSEMISLLKNYRSTQTILDPAYTLIQNNNPDTLESKLGISKKLVSAKKNGRVSPKISEFGRLDEEVDFVVSEIEKLLAENPDMSYRDIAILARANNHLDPFVVALRGKEIPYQLIGNRGLYDKDEVKNALAFLHVLASPRDGVSLFRVLSNPVFEILPTEISRILSDSKYKKIDFWDCVTSSSNEKIQNLVKVIADFQKEILKLSPSLFVYKLINDTGMLTTYTQEETAENLLAIKNINLFLDQIKLFERDYFRDHKITPNVLDFLEYLDLMVEAGDNPAQAEIEDIDTVNLSTVHSAKGLEYQAVFIVNLVSGRFPSRERGDLIEIPAELIKETLPTGDEHVQEERRLFYVAMTRAKKYLYLTYAGNYGGKRDAVASGFISETGLKISKEAIQVQSKETQTMFGVDSDYRRGAPLNRPFNLDYVSYTQISAFQTCPLKYKYAYVVKIPTSPSHALTFGNSIHATLRDFHVEEKFSGELSFSRLLELYKKNWDGTGYLDPKQRDQRYASGEKFLKEYYQKEKGQSNKIIELEKTINLRLAGVKFSGRVDRIDRIDGNKVEIIDYKTGKIKEQKDVDKDIQTSLYAWGVRETLNYEPELLTLYFVEDTQKVSSHKTLEQIRAQVAKTEEVVETMKSGDFTATPGFHCDWCDYKDLCPFAKEGL